MTNRELLDRFRADLARRTGADAPPIDKKAAAALIGISRQQWYNYEGGAEIPLHIRLAMSARLRGLRPLE